MVVDFGQIIFLVLVVLTLAVACQDSPKQDEGTALLEQVGLRATVGAAPGYVGDAGCELCHADIAASYKAVGMANSFGRPQTVGAVEDFSNAEFYHEASNRHYRMHWRDDELWFERFRIDADGKPEHLVELRVDWVVGSGNRARSYLYQTPAGEIYMLPLGWYSQEGVWAMSPGYEGADHSGIERLVRRECLFCHNAYPEVPVGADRHDQPHLFPDRMPEGIGCQRCHGPGAEHVRTALRGDTIESIHAAIHNPGRGTWAEKNAVCFQCHLQPAVEISGVRSIDRTDFSYRPNEDLHDYMIYVDIDEAGRKREDRFQINHHAYRLMQSTCFTETAGQMGCLTCHDPHVKIPQERQAEHYRQRCLSCHTDLDSDHEAAQRGAIPKGGEGRDCVTCHMPQRRTEDVIHVVMTDHRIARGPVDHQQLLDPLEPREPMLTGLDLMYPENVPSSQERMAYRALAALKAGVPAALDQFQSSVLGMEQAHPGWYYELARFLLVQQRYEEAIWVIEMLRDSAAYPNWSGMRALSLMGLGYLEEAIELYGSELDDDTNFQPQAFYNLGLVFRARGEIDRSRSAFQTALDQRPVLLPAWYQLGELASNAGEIAEARRAYMRALQINPDTERVLDALKETR
jgi:hypothetical protein